MSVLGVVAAAASFFIPGGQTGAFAMYAYSAGSAVESLINPQTIEGPRLNELNTQLSVYGAPMPVEWGVNRHPGTIIWPQTLTAVEHSHSESSKGGPETETFTYTLSLGVFVCQGPIVGIRRIWANKKLIYDFSSANTGPNVSWRIGGIVESILGAPPANVRVYLGTEDQTADPLIEATDGPSPAYLGSCYVVFEDYDVTDSGGRPPQFEFEVISAGFLSPGTGPELLGDGGLTTYLDGNVYSVTGTNCFVYDAVTGELVATVALPYAGESITNDGTKIWVGYSQSGFGTSALASRINPATFTIDLSTKFGYGGAVSVLGTVVWNPILGLLYGYVNNGTGAGVALYFKPSDLSTGGSTLTAPHYVYHTLEMPDIGKVALAGFGNWIVIGNFATDATLATIYNAAWGSSVSAHRMAYDASRNCVYWINIGSPNVYRVDLTSYVLTTHLTISSINIHGLYFDADGDMIYVDNGANLEAYDPDTAALMFSGAGYGVMTGFSRGSSLSSGDPNYYFQSEQSSPPGVLYKVSIHGRLNPEQVLLSTIVSDICVLAGMETSDIDVTDLTDLVDGYVIPRQMTARAAIEALQKAYFFDAVESDDKIKFVKRGGSIAGTMLKDDRAAHESGSDAPDSLNVLRAFELELPNEVDVEYPDVDADHLVGNQYARRITKETLQKLNIQTPVVMTGGKALQIANTSLYLPYLNQSFRWTTSRKYAEYEPTDVVYLPTDEVTYAARITSRRDQPNGIIEWEGQIEDSHVYDQPSTGAATTGYLPQTIDTLDDTILVLMDCGLLRDEDDNAGYYSAMGGEL